MSIATILNDIEREAQRSLDKKYTLDVHLTSGAILKGVSKGEYRQTYAIFDFPGTEKLQGHIPHESIAMVVPRWL